MSKIWHTNLVMCLAQFLRKRTGKLQLRALYDLSRYFFRCLLSCWPTLLGRRSPQTRYSPASCLVCEAGRSADALCCLLSVTDWRTQRAPRLYTRRGVANIRLRPPLPIAPARAAAAAAAAAPALGLPLPEGRGRASGAGWRAGGPSGLLTPPPVQRRVAAVAVDLGSPATVTARRHQPGVISQTRGAELMMARRVMTLHYRLCHRSVLGVGRYGDNLWCVIVTLALDLTGDGPNGHR